MEMDASPGIRGNWPQLLGVVILCAIGAELLAAYRDDTGHPAGVAFSVVFFGALYGAPALLAREVVRRCGWGWPSLLLLFGALGVAQACLIDQSMFSADYFGYRGWEQTREATLIPPLGVSAYNAYNFIFGHVIYSFGAPVALVEAWRPTRAHRPWLSRTGIVVALVVYLGTAALILIDPGSRTGNVAQLIASALVVLGLTGLAVVIGRRPRRHAGNDRQIPVPIVLAAAFALAMVSNLGGETWAGFAIGVATMTIAGGGLLLASRRTAWSIRHCAAVGLGFLLARGLLAFTYFPLLGEVAPGPKYAHNTVMLLAVLIAGAYALRTRPSEAR